MTTFVRRSAAVLMLALLVTACGGAAEVSSGPSEPSLAASQADAPSTAPTASVAPSEAASDAAAPSACLEAGILATLDAYMDGEVPAEPSMEDVADALAALELDGRAAEFRDGVVEAFRGETGETLDEMKLHDALFSLIPLQSEVRFEAC